MTDFLETLYKKNPMVIHREIAGEVVLVPIRRNVADMESIYSLEGVGASVWDLIDGKRTMGDIRNALVDEYDVDPEILDADLIEFVEQLESIGALKAA